MKKIRWGIAGPGIIANKFAAAIQNVPDAELVAVASRDGKKAEAFAQKHGIPMVFTGYEAMAKSDAVDAVYVSTPHAFHKPCAEIFLNAGKHVLCEKPVCVNAHQAQKLKECGEKNGVFLMEAMWTRFLPAILEAQEIVKRGEIGEVLGVEADFCYNTPYQEGHRLFTPALAGGALLDVGVYGLHFADMFLGRSPEQILSMANNYEGVDMHTTVLLKYKNGAVANITSALNVEKPETAYIYGSKGWIYVPHFYGATELFVHTENGERHVVKKSIGDGFEEEIMEVCQCIRDGKQQSDIHPMAKSIVMLQQMDEVRKQIGIRYPLEGEA